MTKKKTIQNEKPPVENIEVQTLLEITRNEVVAEATQAIFDELFALENMKNFSENLCTEIKSELMHASFLTEQLELTEKQQERLAGCINSLIERSKNNYLANIKKDSRTQKVAQVIDKNLTAILEEMLSSLAKEVNRGALINCVAVAADTKNEDWNKIELRALKSAGDITIPTRCLLVATNCVEYIQQSVSLQLQPITEKPIDNIIKN